jgi:hypothetical protein
MTNKIQWRVAPPLHLAEAVRRLAMAEGRSDTNMITRLIAEAVSTRRALDARKPELVRLVEIIRGDRQAT